LGKMLINRATVSVVLSAFFVSAAPGPLFAQAVLQPEPVRAVPSTGADESIAQLFYAYPDGGPELAARIAEAVVQDPNTAHTIVAYARTYQVTEAQKLAAEQGIAEALKRLRATDFGGGGVAVAVVLAALVGVGIWAATDSGGGSSGGSKKMHKKVSPN
jgi:hypothetical protein